MTRRTLSALRRRVASAIFEIAVRRSMRWAARFATSTATALLPCVPAFRDTSASSSQPHSQKVLRAFKSETRRSSLSKVNKSGPRTINVSPEIAMSCSLCQSKSARKGFSSNIEAPSASMTFRVWASFTRMTCWTAFVWSVPTRPPPKPTTWTRQTLLPSTTNEVIPLWPRLAQYGENETFPFAAYKLACSLPVAKPLEWAYVLATLLGAQRVSSGIVRKCPAQHDANEKPQ